MSAKSKDLTGMRFGNLVVIEKADGLQDRYYTWRCCCHFTQSIGKWLSLCRYYCSDKGNLQRAFEVRNYLSGWVHGCEAKPC